MYYHFQLYFCHKLLISYHLNRHIQGPRLKDTGYDLVPAITPQLAELSEIIFDYIFALVILLAATSFIYKRPQVYFVCLYYISSLFGVSLYQFQFLFIIIHAQITIFTRVLFVISLCVICRCISFLATSLPGPAPHCQPESTEYNPPKNLHEVIFTYDPLKRCGDLIFSSHTALSLIFVISIFIYGKYLLQKRLYQILCYFILVPSEILLLILIIAARKHCMYLFFFYGLL